MALCDKVQDTFSTVELGTELLHDIFTLDRGIHDLEGKWKSHWFVLEKLKKARLGSDDTYYSHFISEDYNCCSFQDLGLVFLAREIERDVLFYYHNGLGVEKLKKRVMEKYAAYRKNALNTFNFKDFIGRIRSNVNFGISDAAIAAYHRLVPAEEALIYVYCLSSQTSVSPKPIHLYDLNKYAIKTHPDKEARDPSNVKQPHTSR